MISPVLFTLYTNDERSENPDMVFIKYSDETVIVDTTNSAQQLQSVVDDFSLWCRDNHLTLNISKTNEMVIDFRRSSTSPPALQLDGQIIVRLEE